MAIRVYVGNLPYSVGDEQLAELFSVYGTVAEAIVMHDRATGQSKGFGFVQMEDDEAARKAVQSLDGTMMAGRTIHVNEAEERRERDHEGGPRRDFGDRPPRRDFGDRRPPRRDVGGDRGPRRGTSQPWQGDEGAASGWERRHTFDRGPRRERDDHEDGSPRRKGPRPTNKLKAEEIAEQEQES